MKDKDKRPRVKSSRLSSGKKPAAVDPRPLAVVEAKLKALNMGPSEFARELRKKAIEMAERFKRQGVPIAEELNAYTSQAIGNWLKGRRGIPPREFELVSEVLKISMDELVGRPAPGTAIEQTEWLFPDEAFPKKLFYDLTPLEISALGFKMRTEATSLIASRVDQGKQAAGS